MRNWLAIVVTWCSATACTTVELDDRTEAATLSVTWTNVVRATAIGASLTKTGTTSAWNGGAVSVETIAGDGYVEFSSGEATTMKTAGLSRGDDGQKATDIDFAIRLRANGSVGIYEAGVLVANGGTYVAGDVFRVQVKYGTVTYHRNGTLLRTSAVAPTFPLLVDTALYTPGATITNVELVAGDLTWQNVVGVSPVGDDLTKTATTNQWTAGASSVETLGGDGYVELVAGETTTSRAAGLSNGDDSQSYADIDYAIRLGQNGTANVFEDGVFVLTIGAYVPGDRFRIEVVGGVVEYSKNGARPFHASTIAPTYPLRVDTAFLTPGGTIRDIELVAAAQVCPAFDGTGTICNGSFVVRNEIDLAQIADCVNITGDLTIAAPGMVEIALPKLERIGGILRIGASSGDNEELEHLRLPALKEVFSVYGSYPTPPTLDLSRLRTVANEWFAIGSVEISLPCLDSMGSFYGHSSVPSYLPRLREVFTFLGGVISAPALEVVGGSVAGQIDAPILETIARDVDGQLTAPALTYVGGDVWAIVVAPLLTEIGRTLHLRVGSELPALVRTGHLVLHSDTALPSLETTGSISDYYCEEGSPISLTAVDLPALTRATSVELCWFSLASVNLPQLWRVESFHVHGTTAITLLELPALTTVDDYLLVGEASSFPVLGTVGGSFDANEPTTAPVLVDVGGNLYVDSSVNVPELAHVGGDLLFTLPSAEALIAPSLSSIDGALRVRQGIVSGGEIAVSLPGLTTVERILVDSGIGLTSLDLPSLTTIAAGTLLVQETPVASISLPLLQAIPGNLVIRENPSLTSLDFSSLTSIGTKLVIRANPSLPACYATDVRDQLLAAGWTGTISIGGNTGTGSCP